MDEIGTETVEAVAEVVKEEDGELRVQFTPASITANFDTLDARVDELLAPYIGAKYDLTDPQAIKDAKRDRAYLNSVAKGIDEGRKRVKAEYMQPFEAFNDRATAIVAKVKAAGDQIKEQLDSAEEGRRAAKRLLLERHYEDMAGLLQPVVPYDRLHEEQWLNKTYPVPKAEAGLEAKVERLAQDWETLKAQREGMPHYELAERELFRTLDLGAALTAARAADEEDARIAALREATEGRPAPDEAQEVEMEGGPNGGDWDGGHGEPYADEPVPPRRMAVEPSPGAAPEPVAAPAPAPAPPVPAPAPPAPQEDAPRPWVMVIPAATRAQVMALARDARVYGVSGEMRSGTLAEVYERSVAGGR